MGLALVVAVGCAKNKDTESTAPALADAGDPRMDSNTYVSSEVEEETLEEAPPDDGFASESDCDCKVTSPEAAHELADEAVADRLNQKQTWTHSPVLPSTWPTTDKRVRIFFFPTAEDPKNMSQGVLFTAAWAVDISLEDGTTEVSEIKKKKQLGVIQHKRPSMLERNELALAERALVHTVMGGDATTGENSFWGYRKYFLEHPKMAKDLRRKSPDFVKWVENYKK
jgi:hypothetical protein